jgi:microcystin-dependent protein
MKKVTGALAAFLYSTTSLWGATLLPNGMQQFIDANGKPYANGKVYFYSNYPTCSVLKNTYQNEAGSVLNTNPVVLSAMGTATIFGSGAYCQVLQDSLGNTVWTKYTSDTSSASNLGWGGTSGGTANAQSVTVTSFTSTNGQSFYFIAGFTNTGAMTLAVNGGSPLSVVRDTPTGTLSLAGGEVVAGNVVGVTYTSATGVFHLITNTTQIGYAGEIRTFAMSSCPSGWLVTNGAAVSATTYANLFGAIGTTWGTSAGNVVLPNFQDQFLRGAGLSPVGTYEADTYLNHSHGVTDPGHLHALSANSTGFATGSLGSVNRFESFGSQASPGNVSGNTYSATTGLTVNTSTTGGTETRPKNYRVQFCIKY